MPAPFGPICNSLDELAVASMCISFIRFLCVYESSHPPAPDRARDKRVVSSGSLMTAPEASSGKSRWYRAINKTRFACLVEKLLSTRESYQLPKMRLGSRRCRDTRSRMLLPGMMETKNGQQPPELMSTHPADSTRISQLENLMPGALEEYQKAIAGH
jgi:hypothetical protein